MPSGIVSDLDVLVAIRGLSPIRLEALTAWLIYLSLASGNQTTVKNVLNEEPSVHLK